MSRKIRSQDLSFEDIWRLMDSIEPLTPITSKEVEAKKIDDYMFGDADE